MNVINFADTPSLVGQYMTELRDVNVQGDMLRFRRNLERIGEIMAYEISKTLRYDEVEINTPLSECRSPRLAEKLVLATIFRAGVPFHQGFLNFFDHAENAFVSAYRKYKDNFLHRSWGPLEPFDDSMPELLKEHGVHTHLVTDHYHYFEDGGATYHTRYRSYEAFRGQEGDAWKGVVGGVPRPENGNAREELYWNEQDFVNRSYMDTADKQSQSLTFDAGLHFMERNRDADSWFLQIETFDPHEPFYSQQKFKDLYPHEYHGKLFDWPLYQKVTEDAETVNHLRMEYAALLSMCDESLGRVLDLMDRYDMWKDTMLIVCTDHGFMLGEHDHWAKCYFPFYNEVANTPLFIWDPRSQVRNEHRKSLVQTIDPDGRRYAG